MILFRNSHLNIFSVGGFYSVNSIPSYLSRILKQPNAQLNVVDRSNRDSIPHFQVSSFRLVSI